MIVSAGSYVRRDILSLFIDEKSGKDPVQKLFDVYGPKYKSRNGGYTRVLKTDNRRGDNAPLALVAFVD